MYGWIHECLKVMIINYYSEEIWNEIIKKAGEEKYQWKDVEEYISDNNFFYLHSITANIIGINEIQVSLIRRKKKERKKKERKIIFIVIFFIFIF